MRASSDAAWSTFALVSAKVMATTGFRDELTAHLKQFSAAPFVFVGAGMSRRYPALPGWEAPLRRYADVAGRPYEYFAATAGGDYPAIATLIARELHEAWWNDDAFEDSRAEYPAQ
jgi:hypothetical protein